MISVLTGPYGTAPSGLDQLETVDDHQTEILDASALGDHIGYSQQRRVVNVDAGSTE